MDLKDRIALVTGSATGIGKSICEELLKSGCKVAICDLDSDAGELTAEQLGKQFGKERTIFCHCDVTDYEMMSAAFQSTISEFGGLDIVINNAEIMNDKFWELEVDVNLNGAIRGTLLAQQFMGKDRGGKGGIVINIGSAASVRPQISTPIFSATKHAIIALSRSSGDVYHYNNTGVSVIAVCPGPFENQISNHSNRFKTPIHEKAFQLDMNGIIPQKLENVAKGVVKLISDAKTGTIWVIANNKPAKEMPYSCINL